MKERTRDQIIGDTILNFCLSDDYLEARDIYNWIIASISNSDMLQKITELENMYRRKAKTEILYSYKRGFDRICDDYKKRVALFELDIDESIKLYRLRDTQVGYYGMEQLLNRIRNSIRATANNTLDMIKIESLFEIYSTCNFEVAKIAYALGLGLHQELIAYLYSEMCYSTELIGKKLRECRNFMGITQSELGLRLRIDRVRISHYERGKIMPPIDILIKYSKLFKVSLEYFLNDGISVDEVVDNMKNIFSKVEILLAS